MPHDPPKKGWLAAFIDRRLTAPADASRVALKGLPQNSYPTIGPAAVRNGKPVSLAIKPDAYGDMRDIVTEGNGLLDILPGVGEIRGLAQGKQLADEGHPLLGAALGAVSALPLGGAAVKKLSKKATAQILERAAAGGFTFDPRLGSFVEHGGVMVGGVPGQKGMAVAAGDDVAKALEKFRASNAELLSQDGMMMGGWFDKDSNKFFFDVSQRVPREEAPALLKARGEKAGWDLDAGEELVNPHATEAVSAGSEPEKIIGVAFRKPDGTIVRGEPGDIHPLLLDRQPDAADWESWKQGFHTTGDRFVSRKEAGEIARKSKQFTGKLDRSGLHGVDLEERDAAAAPQLEAPGLLAPEPKAGPGDLGPDGKYTMPMSEAAAGRSDPIVAAAVTGPDGKVYQGITHGDAFDQMEAEHGKKVTDYYRKNNSWHDLFVTKSGATVNRRALADEWNGRRPIAEMMKLPGEAAPQLEAPGLLGVDSERDVIPLDVSTDPAGVDASRPPLYRPTDRVDLSVLDAVKRRVRDVYTPAAEKGLKEGGLGPAWYDLSPLKRIFEEESPSGAQDFKMFTALMGPTSAGTDVPMNIRQASLFYKLWKEGKLTPEALAAKSLEIPPGYGNRLNIRGPLARVVENSQLDPLATPKTFRYSEQLGGGSWGGTALDRHVGYNVGLLGEHTGSEINTAGSGMRGFPTAGYAETRKVSTSPQDTHYAAIEDAMVREAEKLGVHPAVYQAAGWVGNAAKTGVEDARHPLEIINAKLGETAKRFGHKSRTAALRAFIRGETPLWALGGLGAYGLLSQDEQPAGGLLGEQ